ncbi:hypothetical protein GCM10027073_41490 [Streptomyces chlorus]|uniref:DUF4232 domain-containing protein n=1 Tax=Streptomyces chlorus TaxID=887452 RepID=A0ABW1DWU5_9ACTN
MSGGKDARGEDVRGEEREQEGRGAEEGTPERTPGGAQCEPEPEGDEREPEEREPEEQEPEVRASGEREPEEGAAEEGAAEEGAAEERAAEEGAAEERAAEEGAAEERAAEERAAEERAAEERAAEERVAEAHASEGASESEGVTGADGPGSSDGDGPRVPRGPVSPLGQQTKQSHAGNGTVNDGSDHNADLDAQGPEQGAGQGAGLLDPDELELRSLLHSSVSVVEPSEGSLDYLRRAVPARRARKRQILVGAAAAALFVGTAVPALVHVSQSTGLDADPSAIGHASQAQGGTGKGVGPDGGETTAGGTSDQVEKGRKDGKKDKEKDAGTGASTGVTEGANPSASAAAGSPACTVAQLGPAVASSGAPDSTGAVYGSFRVANVSTAGCTVGGPGSLSVTPLGAADAARVGPARHVAGDAAAGLPDSSLEAGQLMLKPGESYDVKFAWVPSEPCPVNRGGGDTGGTGDPSPDPSPSAEPTVGDGTSTGDDTATVTQLLTADGTADGSVTVTYTPASGAGTATVTVSNACAGTVYWTGLLPTTAS